MDKCCNNCKYADRYCICVVCEDGKYVVCNKKGKHMLKTDLCDKYEKTEDK